MRKNPLGIMGCALVLSLSTATQQESLLIRSPSVSNKHISFTYAGDIWVADRDGQHLHRITVNPDSETEPMLSPDGKWIALYRH
ncbi:PD40 domain-containing protein [Chitinophaga pendula]|uniref:PD40 domain-containing protein n=1 Tax=Chitinophaga TaxID=79328 RepID=UPI0012FE5712|nr:MULTISPECIES: PD40 domain-containing protein [Chitinophaga]UCJ06478.1 PD40 domain-containing protein [Chitinophaga pendula]